MKFSVQITALVSLLFSTTNAQYEIDPNSVSNSTRQGWCQQQQAQCPLICAQTTPGSSAPESNDCDPVSLTYACVCSNGLSPNISEYSQTLPYYICQAWGSQCVSNCGQANNACAESCRTEHPCGAQNPSHGNASVTAALSSGSGTAALPAAATSQSIMPIGLGNAAAGQTSGAVRVRMWALSVGQTFGTLAVAGAVVGGMAVLL